MSWGPLLFSATAISLVPSLLLAWQIYAIGKKERQGLVAESILDLVGNTPIVRINGLSEETGCEIYAKLEYVNPGGSSKDRVAKKMIEEAEKDFNAEKTKNPKLDVLHIFEGTSGSTGISLAMFCKIKGYKCTVVLPDDQSNEKYTLLESLGARLIKVKNASITNDKHYVNVAAKLAKEESDEVQFCYFANQFENLSNFRAHFTTTAPEIDMAIPDLDVLVHSAGTGGTISGIAKYFEKKRCQIVLADPQGSCLHNRISSGVMFTREMAENGLRRNRYDTIVQGVGMDRLTENIKPGLDHISASIKVTDTEMRSMAKKILAEEGLMVGSSSALNLHAVYQISKNLPKGSKLLTLCCSHGSREPHLFSADGSRSR